MEPRRTASVDVTKGAAILAVLWQHTVPSHVSKDAFAALWIRPAVPVFFVVFAMKGLQSLSRDGDVPGAGRSASCCRSWPSSAWRGASPSARARRT